MKKFLGEQETTRKRSVAVGMDDDQVNALKALARRKRTSVSAIVREAVDAYVSAARRESAGAGR